MVLQQLLLPRFWMPNGPIKVFLDRLIQFKNQNKHFNRIYNILKLIMHDLNNKTMHRKPKIYKI